MRRRTREPPRTSRAVRARRLHFWPSVLPLVFALAVLVALALALLRLLRHLIRLDLEPGRLVRGRVEARADVVALLELVQPGLHAVTGDRRARGDLQFLLAAGRGRDLHRPFVL